MTELPPSRKPRRWPYWLAALLALWCAAWYGGSLLLQHQLAKLRADLAESGSTVTCDKESWGGFPFKYTLTCQKPRLHVSAEPPTEATADQLQLLIWFPNPFHVRATLTGPTHIDAQSISHDPAIGSLTWLPWIKTSASLSTPKADWQGAGSATDVRISITRNTTKVSAAAAAKAITLHSPEGPVALNEFSGAAETDSTLLDAEHPLDDMAAKQLPLKISSLTLKQGAAEISGSGELTLDAQHLLNGKLSSDIADIDAFMAVLASDLKLKEGEVAAAKTVIGLLGGDPASKARKLDVIAKAGELYFGPFKFADVPPFK